MTPTRLIPHADLDVHVELLQALGTENIPTQWMEFMLTVTRLMPDVLSSGRPSADAIQRSPIGRLGFKSWQAMIEAPVAEYGLGWNFSAWKAWRRAWNTVQANPWLAVENMTSSEVNTLALDCKNQGLPFPQSRIQLESMLEAKAEAKAQAKAESLQGITERAERAEKGLTDATASLNTLSARIALLEGQLATALGQVAEQAETIGTLRAEKTQVETERDGWKKRAQAKPAEPASAPRAGVFKRLWSFLRGK